MSTDPTDPAETELPATGPFSAAPHAKDTSADRDTGAKAPNSLLTRPTDHAAKPGFRSPPNKHSKAQKPARKK